jgi:hypothetical protein
MKKVKIILKKLDKAEVVVTILAFAWPLIEVPTAGSIQSTL